MANHDGMRAMRSLRYPVCKNRLHNTVHRYLSKPREKKKAGSSTPADRNKKDRLLVVISGLGLLFS